MKHLILASVGMSMFGWMDWYLHNSGHHNVTPYKQTTNVTNTKTSEIPAVPIFFNGQSIRNLLTAEENHISPEVVDQVITSLDCAQKHQITYQPILTIIDYSLPSNQKRLWVFDLLQQRRLFYTYVSHGLKSGETQSNYFSNRNNSRASSIGVYKTEQSYYGREGLSLRLTGLDPYFNDNANLRSIVMHGGWYVEEDFIKRYGRAGRSWGCPALPLNDYRQIIQSIKNNSLIVVYYPSERWIKSSKFLNCNKNPTPKIIPEPKPNPQYTSAVDSPKIETVLFAKTSHGAKLEESSPIMAIPAGSYTSYFHQPPPLNRMLRRQVANQEYIALTTQEFEKISHQPNPEILSKLNFILPTIKMVNGYYETVMKPMNFGQIKLLELSSTATPTYKVYFENRAPLQLTTAHRFIRWLGL